MRTYVRCKAQVCRGASRDSFKTVPGKYIKSTKKGTDL